MKFHKKYVQSHPLAADEVFPLLSPEGEVRWLDNWKLRMIHSDSGKTEKGCIFSTNIGAEDETIWIVANYEPENGRVSFIQFPPNKNITEISIKVVQVGHDKSQSEIEYSFTPLTTNEHERLSISLDAEFKKRMESWEKALNHFLRTGEMLTE